MVKRRQARPGQESQRGAERIAERMAVLRARIAENRSKAISKGADGKLLQLPDTPRLRRRKWTEIASALQADQDVSERVNALLADDAADKTAQMAALGAEFLYAAETGNANRIYAFLQEGFPSGFQDTESGQSALHITAACRARNALRILLRAPDIDYLIRDNQGRLASEMAFIYGHDPALARLLRIKERKQAMHEGIAIARRPKPD